MLIKQTHLLRRRKKTDGGSERQFAAHLIAAIKVLENYWQTKAFCHGERRKILNSVKTEKIKERERGRWSK